MPRNSFVRVRGLPPMAALSEGHSIAPGSWAVPLAALPDLKIMLPAAPPGRSEIVITLVAVDGSVLAEAKSTLAVAAAAAASRAASAERDATGHRQSPPCCAPACRQRAARSRATRAAPPAPHDP